MRKMFEWDDKKNTANMKKHGICFEEASEIFSHPVFTAIDDRNDYGEVREISIGLLDDAIVIVVVHTNREGITRIISARKAKQAERKVYYDYLEKTFGDD